MIKLSIAAGHTKLVILGITALTLTSISAATMFSLALFTDQQTDDSTFTTGTIALNAAAISAMNLTVSDMMPGDTTRGPVTVQNDGSVELRYAISQASTNDDAKDLRDTLTLEVRTADTGDDAFATDGDYCDDGSGTQIHAPAAMGASGNVVGDPTAGFNSGDRALGAGISEVLCFYVSMPIEAGNALQGSATTTTFTFDAEQTANN